MWTGLRFIEDIFTGVGFPTLRYDFCYAWSGIKCSNCLPLPTSFGVTNNYNSNLGEDGFLI